MNCLVLTPEERQLERMRILNDALSVIQKPFIDVRQNFGFVIIESDRTFDPFFRQDRPFHTNLLEEANMVCRVCARGALFLADVDKNNKVHIRDIQVGRGATAERLSPYFTEKELQLIECVFENYGGGCEWCDEEHRDTKLSQAAGYLANGARLRAMLEFLIQNNGVVE